MSCNAAISKKRSFHKHTILCHSGERVRLLFPGTGRSLTSTEQRTPGV